MVNCQQSVVGARGRGSAEAQVVPALATVGAELTGEDGETAAGLAPRLGRRAWRLYRFGHLFASRRALTDPRI
jgi:hypothetical protein